MYATRSPLFLAFLLFLKSMGFSQNPDPTPRALQIKQIDEEVNLDGILNETVWQDAEKTLPFFQRFPADTSMAIYQTEVMMAYDEDFVYLAAICHDNPEGNYVVNSLRRDFETFGNDYFSLVLDPFLDQVNGFEFSVSPYGAQREAIINNGGNGRDALALSWDNKWYSKVRRSPDRWVVEMAIPFKTLRYREGVQEWNVNFVRQDYKNNERTNWAWIGRNFRGYNLGYTGKLKWDKPLKKPSRNISAIPYITGGISKNHEDGEAAEAVGDVGGDVKVGLSSALNLDLTINPDFSQVEVDRQVNNLTRFEITFPERRQFFLENNDLFSSFGTQSARPFFTRRIGLAKDINTDETVQNKILGGARLSGKLSKNLRLGLLNVQTAKDEDLGINATNYTVGVLQQQVFKTSNISAIMVNKQQFVNDAEKDTMSPYNRVVGIDYNHISPDNKWVGKVFYHRSMMQGKVNDAFSHGASMLYNTAALEAQWNHEIVGEGFDAETGFIRRTNYKRIRPSAEVKFYPESRIINRYSFELENDMLWAENKGLTDRTTSLDFALRFEGSGFVRFGYENDYVKLLDPFDPTRSDQLELEAGSDFNTHRFTFFIISDLRKRFNVRASGTMGGFFNGQRYGVSGSLNYRVQPLGVFSVDYSIDRVVLPEPYNTANILVIGPRVDLAFTNTLFFSTLLQYNSRRENININSRFQWRFKPASDLFIVYTDNYDTSLNPFGIRNRGIVLKLTYWINV